MIQPDLVQAMIARFVAACQADPRVVTAILYGSYAEGTADVYSDLDLALFTTDEAHADFQAERAAFIRQLGEPLFLENFNLPHVVFVIFADGTEVELTIGRASEAARQHIATYYRVLLDKTGLLAEAGPVVPGGEQAEALRRQVYWFWHDLSHFIVAIGRGQLWWAQGQLYELRRFCIDLARLHHDFTAEPLGYWKVDEDLPAGYLGALRQTFPPLERHALLRAAQVIVGYYQSLAAPLAQQHGIAYPAALERGMLERLAALELPPPG